MSEWCKKFNKVQAGMLLNKVNPAKMMGFPEVAHIFSTVYLQEVTGSSIIIRIFANKMSLLQMAHTVCGR